jgi:hypothetical protein
VTSSRDAISAIDTPPFSMATIRFSRSALAWRAALRASIDRWRGGEGGGEDSRVSGIWTSVWTDRGRIDAVLII